MKDVALVGLPYSGKSTVFSAVSRAHAAGSPVSASMAVVKVPDERLDTLAKVVEARKITHAQVRLVDVPGLSAQSLGQARAADALAVVIKAFGSDADPAADLASFRAECAVADLTTIEKSLDRVKKKTKSGDANAKAEAEIFQRAEAVLSSDKWLSEESWTPEEWRTLQMIGPLTVKPVLHVANVEETWDGTPTGLPEPVVAVRGLLEAEAAELDADEAVSLLGEFGVSESATDRVVDAVFQMLDLIRFYTGNEVDARAWEIPRHMKAPQAAGQVHTDFEKGFIRWEAVDFNDFIELTSWDAARNEGKLRVEGRDYEVKDGDVVRILHS